MNNMSTDREQHSSLENYYRYCREQYDQQSKSTLTTDQQQLNQLPSDDFQDSNDAIAITDSTHVDDESSRDATTNTMATIQQDDDTIKKWKTLLESYQQHVQQLENSMKTK